MRKKSTPETFIRIALPPGPLSKVPRSGVHSSEPGRKTAVSPAGA